VAEPVEPAADTFEPAAEPFEPAAYTFDTAADTFETAADTFETAADTTSPRRIRLRRGEVVAPIFGELRGRREHSDDKNDSKAAT
jgi:hypothetical protein